MEKLDGSLRVIVFEFLVMSFASISIALRGWGISTSVSSFLVAAWSLVLAHWERKEKRGMEK
jgi:hypothetical protein